MKFYYFGFHDWITFGTDTVSVYTVNALNAHEVSGETATCTICSQVNSIESQEEKVEPESHPNFSYSLSGGWTAHRQFWVQQRHLRDSDIKYTPF